ncbi:TonB family protein [Myxococcota bacterium]|nr:TonB family protein [Myxococcota bacterium]MBU1430027.1 TonB family protein [Myxococcota bacterium]MBU1899424.1 TonB family protein [Myxococcota bacterium]
MRRILRLGLIHNGRIIEERLIRHGGHISIGTHPRCTLVLPPGAPLRSHRLFKRERGGYTLEYTGEMKGRIANGGHVLDLAAVAETGWAKPTRAYQLALSEEVRGKLHVAGYQLLFQFVQAPPSARLQLPQAMRRGRGLDWPLIQTLGASALVQGALVAVMLSMDLPSEPVRLSDLDDRFQTVIFAPPPAPEVSPTTEAPPEKDTLGPPAQAPKPKAPAPRAKPEAPAEAPAAAPAEESPAARQARINERIKNETVLGALGTLGDAGGRPIVDILSGGASQISMEDAFSGTTRVAMNTPTGGRDRRPHHRDTPKPGVVGIGEVKSVFAKGPVRLQPKKEQAVTTHVGLGEPSEPVGVGVLSAKVISAKVRSKLPQVKSCYERHLAKTGKLSGKIIVEFTIGEMGRVTEARVLRGSLQHEGLRNCIIQYFKRQMRFPKPKGGSVTARFPFIFTPQG